MSDRMTIEATVIPIALLDIEPYFVPGYRPRRIVPPWDADEWEQLRGAFEDGLLVLLASLERRPLTRQDARRALVAMQTAAPLLDRYRP